MHCQDPSGNDQICYLHFNFCIHNHINLGIAVDLNQEGLLVGTLQEADSFNLKGIARKISEISKLLRDGKYGLDDVSGSTFTISNNGSFNSFLTSPIINQPNVAILSTHPMPILLIWRIDHEKAIRNPEHLPEPPAEASDAPN